MSSQNTVLLQTIFADGVSDTLSDIFVELVKYREYNPQNEALLNLETKRMQK